MTVGMTFLLVGIALAMRVFRRAREKVHVEVANSEAQ